MSEDENERCRTRRKDCEFDLLEHKLPLGAADCHWAALEVDVDNVAIRSTSHDVIPVCIAMVIIVPILTFHRPSNFTQV